MPKRGAPTTTTTESNKLKVVEEDVNVTEEEDEEPDQDIIQISRQGGIKKSQIKENVSRKEVKS